MIDWTQKVESDHSQANTDWRRRAMSTWSNDAASITVIDDHPCKYPTLFDPDGRKLVFQDGGSSFNEHQGLFRCVFRCGDLRDGLYVFAASDHEIAAVAKSGQLHAVDRQVAVERTSLGAPVALSNSPRPRMTITIVTMNRRELLERTLWYIYETSDDQEREIWIWDNASTDDTAAFLGTMVGWPGVRVFRSPTDLGITEPRRQMLRAITTPYIFTLDDDTWMVTKGWVSAMVRALDAEPSIHQLVLGNCVHSTNNFGAAHGILARPFFRIPPLTPQDSGPEINVEDKSWLEPGLDLIRRGGETLLIPTAEQFSFGASGGAAAWRADDVRGLIHAQGSDHRDRHPVCDLRETWGFPLMKKNGTREGLLFRYCFYHPCPGPIWHLGHGESYWAEKVRHSEAIYNRAAGEQARWLEVARATSGWGQPLDDPDDVLP